MKMQILRGTKREITLMQWNEQLENSKECYRHFGDEDIKQQIVEDEQRVSEIEQKIEKVIAYMDAHNIRQPHRPPGGVAPGERREDMFYTDCETLFYNKRKSPKQRTYHKNIDDLFKSEGRPELVGKKIIPSWLGIKNVTVSKEK